MCILANLGYWTYFLNVLVTKCTVDYESTLTLIRIIQG